MTRISASILTVGILVPALFVGGCSANDSSQNGQSQNKVSPSQGGSPSQVGSPSAASSTGAGAGASTPASGEASTPASGGASAGGTTTAAASAPRKANDDVKLTKCQVSDGVATVEANVKNSGSSPANYIVPVQVMQGDKKVDGVAIFVESVEPGAQGKSSMQGQKSNLKGKVTCKVGTVQAM